MNLTSASFLFWIKKMISALILPPLLPFVLIFAGLIFVWRRWRGGIMLVWVGFVIGLLTITPAVVNGLLIPLEPAAALQIADIGDAQAIVVLGGGRISNAPEYGGDTVSRYTLERLRYGARLARDTGLPILVSGGGPHNRPSEALLMKAVLEDDFRTPVRWTEETSLDTRQNARNSAEQLKSAGIRHILLVTHAAHMKRAQGEFELQGLTVTAAPTAWMGKHDDSSLPGPGSAISGWYALHEWLGLIAYRLSQ